VSAADLAAAMRERSVDQLCEIMYFGPETGFTPDAVSAASNELAARSVSSAELATSKERIGARLNEKRKRGKQSLPWPARIALFIAGVTLLGGLFIGPIVLTGLEAKGYDRMADQAWRNYGAGVVVLVIIVLAYFLGS
jgi:hypothetical protein